LPDKRVVRIIARLNTGGPALHVMHLSAGLSDRYPTLLVTGSIAEGEQDLTPLVRERVPDIRIIPALGREISPLRDLRVLLELYRLLRRVRPTIVHTHTAKAGTIGRVAAWLARVPIRIHTFHGHVLRGYFSPAKTRVFIGLERLLARLTTVIIAISPAQADELVNEFHIAPRERFRVIPLGLDLAPFAAPGRADRRQRFRQEIRASTDVVVTCVGRLVPIKNHRLLLRAFAVARRRHTAMRLIIVGDGPERPSLEALRDELGLGGAVSFLGWRSDLDVIYAGSDIVVLTSDNEGTPVSLIEALAAQCAVVSTDVGGVRDVLANGERGVLVPAGDVEAFAEALVGLASDSDRRESLATSGQAAVLRQFSRERLIADIGSLYDELEARRERA
jgi:glycosyltransferase involved in cell wall biosynthesis